MDTFPSRTRQPAEVPVCKSIVALSKKPCQVRLHHLVSRFTQRIPLTAPLSLFDHVYAEPHSGVERQRSRYAAYLRGFES